MKRCLILIAICLWSGCTPGILNSSSPNASVVTRKQSVKIESLKSDIDADTDGIDDFTDIILSARSQIGVVTKYDTSYYSNAYPPEDSGACTDVIWRALKASGYDIKKMIDDDIRKFPKAYGTGITADPNIDFRRVQRVRTFLERHTKRVTTRIEPGNMENLKEWQLGDIVTFAQIPGSLWHIAIVSDQRNEQGVPLLIHNYGLGVIENDLLTTWPAPITGHFRWLVK